MFETVGRKEAPQESPPSIVRGKEFNRKELAVEQRVGYESD